jgi:hypothetical protein
MFPLGDGEFPKDNATLEAALARGIATPAAITLDGGFPSFGTIRVDLSGARFHRGQRPATAPPETADGFFARVVEVRAAPAYFESLPFHLSLRADDCVFAFGRTPEGTNAGVLKSTSNGSLEITASIADIEAAILAVASEAAAAHGASVQSVRVTLESETPRRLSIHAAATAKAMMFSATLTLRGHVEIDDAFHARLSGIACTGEGMIANLAAAQLRPRLAGWEGCEFPLQSVLPPGFALTDVALDADPAHGFRARFRLQGGNPSAGGAAEK